MFDFEKLDVYHQTRKLNKEVLKYLLSTSSAHIDPYIRDQWKKVTIDIAINLVEGVSRISETEKKHHFTVARSFVFESVSLMDILKDVGQLGKEEYEGFYDQYETVSKMLLGLYRSK